MRYIFKSWIKTQNWSGALLVDLKGNEVLTSGIYMWKAEPHRKYEVVQAIDVDSFYEHWNEYYPYCTIETQVKCTYTNGDTVNTCINGTIEDAERYFLGNWFNIGAAEDNMQRCINVELAN